jgi:methyltransferase (TIGR00027 family)
MKANQASATARLIAAATIMQEPAGDLGDTAPEGAAAWCRRFLSTSRTDRFLRWSIGVRPCRTLWQMLERALLPGIVNHCMRRKRMIDRLARDAAAHGYTQLVVLGAGLDTLAFRLTQERLFTRVVSADHPATLSVVRLATAGLPAGPTLVPLDLGNIEEVEAFISSAAVDPSQPTLFVLEGVLMYLDESAIARLLISLSRFAHTRARLIASVMAAQNGKPVGFRGQARAISSWLGHAGEPMRWACDTATAPDFFRRLGWEHARPLHIAAAQHANAIDLSQPLSEFLIVADSRCHAIDMTPEHSAENGSTTKV